MDRGYCFDHPLLFSEQIEDLHKLVYFSRAGCYRGNWAVLDEKKRHAIVIVDDEPGIAEILEEVFLDEGFAPVVFTRAAPALSYIRLYPPALLITDLVLPGMRGEQLIASVRNQFGTDMPIVAMSASVSPRVLAGLTVDAILAKPFDLDQLIAIARDLISRSGRRDSAARPQRRMRITSHA